MKVSQGCIECMRRREIEKTDCSVWHSAVEEILSNRDNLRCAPYLAWLFSRKYREVTGKEEDFRIQKKKYNDLVLSLCTPLRERIEASEDPFRTALAFSRVGNYIDFGALDHVDEETFLSLFNHSGLREEEMPVYDQFRWDILHADTFLLAADNCGEIVLDLLLIEQLKKLNPTTEVTVMVRQDQTFNDATAEDAEYIGLRSHAKILTNTIPSPGVIPELLGPLEREAFDQADVVLSKGQGNYEGISGCKRTVYFLFLCKCDVFQERFHVPKLTGMMIRETDGKRDF